jgi:hypothetical protein
MVNRQNYHWIKAYLEHLQMVMQVNARSLERYRFYLRHTLLWADETSFAEAPNIRPPLPAYLTGVRPSDRDESLAAATLKKICQTTQRFFRWAKMSFPQDFRAVSTAWVESLRPPRSATVVKEHEYVTIDDIGLLEVVQCWDAYVRETLPPTAMWCPPVGHTWGDQALTAERPGANRPVAINKRLRLLFGLAELPPRSSHKFRHGHAVWALQHARTMADYKAISQNLMHSDIRVTDGIYAPLLGNEVQQRVANLAGQVNHPLPMDGDWMSFLGHLSKADIPAALRILADRLAQ